MIKLQLLNIIRDKVKIANQMHHFCWNLGSASSGYGSNKTLFGDP